MSKSFSKEERVAFEDILEGFQRRSGPVPSTCPSTTQTRLDDGTHQQRYLSPPALHRSVDMMVWIRRQLHSLHTACQSQRHLAFSKVCAFHSGRS
jgi:hypothetical protein